MARNQPSFIHGYTWVIFTRSGVAVCLVRPRHCFEIAEITRVANVSEMEGEREGILSWNSIVWW